jgi:hypothetical protein
MMLEYIFHLCFVMYIYMDPLYMQQLFLLGHLKNNKFLVTGHLIYYIEISMISDFVNMQQHQ